MDSTVALTTQCIYAYLVALISLHIMNSMKSPTSKYWTVAWASLAASLTFLLAALQLPPATQRYLYVPYLLGQYCFGLMLVAGCRSRTLNRPLHEKYVLLSVPFGLAAAVLPYLSDNSNHLFIIQGVVSAVLFGIAIYWLDPPN